VRKVGWLMVGSGLLVAGGGHFAMYSATGQGNASIATVGWALGGLCLTLVGLLLVQFRS
jgi:hypothetical protein